MTHHPAAQQLARRVRATRKGELKLSVREIRDVFGMSRLTSSGRRSIDEALTGEALSVTPPLVTGGDLKSSVTLRAVTVEAQPSDGEATQRAFALRPPAMSRPRTPPRAETDAAASALRAAMTPANGHTLHTTVNDLSQRFGRPLQDPRRLRSSKPEMQRPDRVQIQEALELADIQVTPSLLEDREWRGTVGVTVRLRRPPKPQTVGGEARRRGPAGWSTPARWAAGIAAAFVVLVLIGALAGRGGDTGSNTTAGDATTETSLVDDAPTGAESPTTTEESGPTRRDAVAAAEDGDLDQAISLAARIDDDQLRDRYKRRAALAVIRRAKSAYAKGRYVTAMRLARRARADYGSAAREAPAIRREATAARTTQLAVARAEKQAAADRRAAARDAKRAAATAAAAAEAAPEPEPEPDYDVPDSSGGRAGCNPATARDGDGDGKVCE
jgi:hypothetical protein